MTNAKPLQEVAKALGITDNQLRYWLKIMGEQPIREGKLRFVNPETESRLQEMVGLIRQGTPPKEAAAKIKGSLPDTTIIPRGGEDPLEEIRKVLMLLVESNKTIIEENRALRSEVSTLQKQLEYNKPEPIREEPKKENPSPSVSQDRAADPRRVVFPPAEKRPPVQRELSLWESVQLSMNDVAGFLFGRG